MRYLQQAEREKQVEDAEQFKPPKLAEPARTPYDISKIDFERLQQEFARAERQQQTFDLKKRIENRPARMLLADYWPQRAASRSLVETAILDHLYEEPPETDDENEVRLLSARVLGLLMRPGGEQRLH